MSRPDSRLRAVCLAVAMLLAIGREAAAQEQKASPILHSALQAAVAQDVVVHPARSRQETLSRQVLIPLYASFGVMQVLDMHSTLRAVDSGGREANPIVRSAAGSPVAMAALKAGATTGIILLSEKLRKRNRVAAVAMMASLTSAYAVIVARNYAIAR